MSPLTALFAAASSATPTRKEIRPAFHLSGDRHDPFEKYLNEIYTKEFCISPLKSLSLHVTNVNSSYGLSPFINYKKLWDENEC